MQFWPDNDEEYGKVKVTQKSQSEKNGCIVYKFAVVGEAIILTMVSVYSMLDACVLLEYFVLVMYF